MIYVEDELIKLNGVVLPGLVKSIEVIETAKVDEQEVEGSATKPKQATGYEDAKVNIELIIDDTPSQTKYQRYATLRAIFRSPGQSVPQPIPIISEDTAAHGVEKVIFKKLSHKGENKRGQLTAIMAEPSVLQKKTEIFLERDIYPLLKNFPASEKFSLCQEIKQSCYKLIRAAVMANNLTNVNRRLMWLDEADAEKTLLLVLLGVAKNQKYITQKKFLELQGKLEEIGRIIGGLQKFFINNRK